MAPHKQKPSDVALEAKRKYFPFIEQQFPNLPANSFVHTCLEKVTKSPCRLPGSKKLRVAVIDGDCVDVALDWFEAETRNKAEKDPHSPAPSHRIPIVNMADERRAGGDWESGLMAPEENLSRRSNLVNCLTRPWTGSANDSSNYPLPVTGGIYSPHVVVFRSSSEKGYAMWQDFKWLPVISVAPIRRPKLDSTGNDYAFAQEKEFMKEKIRTVLRIAAAWKHQDVCVGAFGAGPGFKNPVQQLAMMWKEILFSEPEFVGLFSNIVFAIERNEGTGAASSSTAYEVFKQQFDASNVYKTAYR